MVENHLDPAHYKFIDDLTLAEAVNLKKCLVRDESIEWIRPVEFHNRSEHKLPYHNSKVQLQLDSFVDYAEENEIKVNKQKSKTMLFNNKRR